MAVTRRYTEPLQVVTTPEMRERITAIAEREQISQAQVVRELIVMALDERETASREVASTATV